MSDKPTAVRVYLARVRTSLADLPASEVEEILEDVRPHLAELETELGPGARVEAMIERLGTPESYAAELRAAGGYPPATDPAEVKKTKATQGLVRPRIALWGLVLSAVASGLVAFMAGVNIDPDLLLGLGLPAPVFMISLALLLRDGVGPVMALPEMRWLAATVSRAREKGDTGRAIRWLGSLKPAWWVLCALVLVVFGLLLMARHRQAVLLMPLLIAAGVAAVWAGQRVGGDRRLLWLVVPVSTFVVGGLLGGLGATVDLVGDRTPYQNATSYYSSTDEYGNQRLTYGGKQVENIYAFDADGKPLTDVFLYDEQGRPIMLTRYGCQTMTDYREKIGEDNRFPRPQIDRNSPPVIDSQGNQTGYRRACRENTEVPFSAAIPKVTPPSSVPPSSVPPSSVPPSSVPVPSTSTPPSSPPSAPSSTPTSPSPTPTK
ncbi:hypothetical protein DMH04_09275 [Kibdelosporangium aridum]|uniref:Proline-rich protein n=1 Tax=Kibdelosporangium aridum TaxID=2030 RepID=A0A428ZIL9_KIBAR|nr:hypothetical protein [Kibdelosporangium aridum]RSM87905.1 hypothetical protein DMH04_09275 [Kibdelosporangium aridum]